MMSSTIPSSAELDRWVETARKCEYLPENDLKVSGISMGAPIGILLVVNKVFYADPYVCLVPPETMWLCKWSSSRREQCTASLNPYHCLWRHTRAVLWLAKVVSDWGASTGYVLCVHGTMYVYMYVQRYCRTCTYTIYILQYNSRTLFLLLRIIQNFVSHTCTVPPSPSPPPFLSLSGWLCRQGIL